MLGVAREKIAVQGIRQMQTCLLDLTVEPPPAQSYDLVCTMLTLHHVADYERVLRALVTLLAPGGYLCVLDLDREDGSFHGEGFHGHTGFDRDEVGTLLQSQGLTPIAAKTCFTITRPRGDVERSYPVFLLIAQRPSAHGGAQHSG